MYENLIRTDPIDFEAAKAEVHKYYNECGWHDSMPPIFHCRSPLDMTIYVAEMLWNYNRIVHNDKLPANYIIRDRVTGEEHEFGVEWRYSEPFRWQTWRMLSPNYMVSYSTPPWRGIETASVNNVVGGINRWAISWRRWKEWDWAYSFMREQGLYPYYWPWPRRLMIGWQGIWGHFPAKGWGANYARDYARWSDLAPWIRVYSRFAFIGERPTAIRFDEEDRVSNYPGPAIEFSDGAGIYALHGVEIPRIWGRLTPYKIDECVNVETRRVLREMYGTEKYLIDSGANLVASDGYGDLYTRTKPVHGESEPYFVVKVVNSTPEPDGTYKDYFLRVPPTVMTPHEAVAWTFGMTADQYHPIAQS